MSIFPKDVEEKSGSIGGKFIKAAEFEGGMVVQAVKVEVVKSANPQYGADEDNYFVEADILKVGETFEYTFKTSEGEERVLNSTSRPFFIGFKQSEIEPGDWVRITRTGKAKQTRFTVEKVEEPEVSPRKEYPKAEDEDIDLSTVPF